MGVVVLLVTQWRPQLLHAPFDIDQDMCFRISRRSRLWVAVLAGFVASGASGGLFEGSG